MDFITAFFKKEREEMAFKSYVADGIKIISENMGRGINIRFIDVLESLNKPKDNRSGAEIAAEVIKKAGLAVKE